MRRAKSEIQPSHANGSLVHSTELPIIQQGDNILISAALLHKRLDVKTKFSTWFERRVEKYGFAEGHDYFSQKREKLGAGRKSTDYLVTIDMAKELAMLEETETGRQIRRYFIQKEKEARGISPLPAHAQGLFKGLKPRRINGRELYPYAEIRERAGYSRHAGGSHKNRYWMHFVKMDNVLYVTREFAVHMLHQKQLINNRVVMQAMQPVLALHFSEPTNLLGNGGI